MAKRKITYEDGSVAFEEIPETQAEAVTPKAVTSIANVPGMEKLGGSAPIPQQTRFPRLLDPAMQDTIPNQINSMAVSAVGKPAIKAGLGLEQLLAPHASGDARLKGAADAVGGAGQIVGIGAAGSAIPTTLKGLAQLGLGTGGAVAGQRGAKDVAERMKLGPGAQELAGAGGGLLGGLLGANLPNVGLDTMAALKSGGLLGAIKKMAIGSGTPGSDKPATGSAAPAKPALLNPLKAPSLPAPIRTPVPAPQALNPLKAPPLPAPGAAPAPQPLNGLKVAAPPAPIKPAATPLVDPLLNDLEAPPLPKPGKPKAEASPKPKTFPAPRLGKPTDPEALAERKLDNDIKTRNQDRLKSNLAKGKVFDESKDQD